MAFRRSLTSGLTAALAVSVGLIGSLVMTPAASAADGGCTPSISIGAPSLSPSGAATYTVSVTASPMSLLIGGCAGDATWGVGSHGGTVTAGSTESYTFTDTGLCATNINGSVLQGGVTATAQQSVGVLPPLTPSGVSNQGVSRTTITVSFNVPTDQCHPVSNVDLVLNGDGGQLVGGVSSPATAINLKPGTTYNVWVSADNSAGTTDGPASAITTTAASKPSAVTNFTVVSTTSNSIAINWASPLDNGGSPITSYAVSWNGGNANTGASNYTLINLQPDTAYTISVSAVNASGAGPASTLPTRTQKKSGPPTVPQGLVASNIQPTTTHLGWAAPASNGGSPITGYNVALNGRAYAATAATGVDLANLAPNTAYVATVSAVNAAGAGPAATVSFRTAGGVAPSSVPGAVVNLQVREYNSTSAVIDWTAPMSDGGSKVTGYKVVNQTTGETRNVAPTVTEAEFQLQPSTTYVFLVNAVNANGNGPVASTTVTTNANGTDKKAQNITVVVHQGKAWKSGVKHAAGSARTSAGIVVKWTVTGKWVKSYKVARQGSKTMITIKLKGGAPKSAPVTIKASAKGNANFEPVSVTNKVNVAR